MALCDTCRFYSKQHDEFRQKFDDVIIKGDKSYEKRFCPMYSDNIPNDIYYKNGDCIYYEKATE